MPSASSYTRRIPPHLNVIDSVYKNNNCVVMRRTLTFSEQRCCFALHIYRVYRPYIKFLEVTCYNKLYITKPRCLTVVAACRDPASSCYTITRKPPSAMRVVQLLKRWLRDLFNQREVKHIYDTSRHTRRRPGERAARASGSHPFPIFFFSVTMVTIFFFDFQILYWPKTFPG